MDQQFAETLKEKTGVECIWDNGALIAKFKIPAEEVSKLENEYFNEIKHHVRIKGFRKGKVPKAIVKKMLGGLGYYAEALKDRIEELVDDFMKKGYIFPYTYSAKEFVVQEGKDAIIKIEFKFPPKVEIKKWEGIEVEVPKFEVKEEDVNKELKFLRERYATLEEVDRPIEDGDFVTVNWEREMPDLPEGEGRYVKEENVVVKMNDLIEPIKKNLLGKKKGDEFEFDFVYPEDIQDERVKGKRAKIKGKVIMVRAKKHPDLDDEFAKKVDPKVGSLEELKEKIRERLVKRLNEKREEIIDRQLEDKLIEENAADIEIPEEMWRKKAALMVEDYAYTLQYMYNIPAEEILRRKGEELIENYKEQAIREAKLELVLDALANMLGIEVTDDEVRAELENVAKAINKRKEEVLEEYEGKYRFELVRQRLRRKKAFDAVKEKVIIKEKEESESEKPAEAGEMEVNQ